MFVGSIRYNLDPFETHSDDDIWNALEIAGLKAKVQSLDVHCLFLILPSDVPLKLIPLFRTNWRSK